MPELRPSHFFEPPLMHLEFERGKSMTGEQASVCVAPMFSVCIHTRCAGVALSYHLLADWALTAALALPRAATADPGRRPRFSGEGTLSAVFGLSAMPGTFSGQR